MILLTGIAIALIAILPGIARITNRRETTTWGRLSEIQAIEVNGTIYIIIQVDSYVSRPGVASPPYTRTVLKRVLAQVSKDGVLESRELHAPSGLLFNPNLTKLCWWNDRILLIASESQSQSRQVWEIDDDQVRELSVPDAKHTLQELGIADVPWSHVHQALTTAMKNYGGETLPEYQAREYSAATSDKSLRIRVEQINGRCRVFAEGVAKDGKKWSVTILEVDENPTVTAN